MPKVVQGSHTVLDTMTPLLLLNNVVGDVGTLSHTKHWFVIVVDSFTLVIVGTLLR
jgi:hypothetical protein